MDLNVKGMFHCARGAVPWMERQGRGVILNTSSMVSFYGQPAGRRLSGLQVRGQRLHPVPGPGSWRRRGYGSMRWPRASSRRTCCGQCRGRCWLLWRPRSPWGVWGSRGRSRRPSYSWPRSRHPISPAWSSGWTDWPGLNSAGLRPLSPRGTRDVQLLAVFGHGTAGDGAALLRQQGA